MSRATTSCCLPPKWSADLEFETLTLLGSNRCLLHLTTAGQPQKFSVFCRRTVIGLCHAPSSTVVFAELHLVGLRLPICRLRSWAIILSKTPKAQVPQPHFGLCLKAHYAPKRTSAEILDKKIHVHLRLQSHFHNGFLLILSEIHRVASNLLILQPSEHGI